MNKKQDSTPLESLLAAVEALRGPNGCQWDKKQTHQSLRKYLLEEAYEVLEVLDSMGEEDNSNYSQNLKEELGDLLFQILFHAQLAKEKNSFTFADIVCS